MNEDRIAGTARNLGGKLEEGVGRVTGDLKEQVQGKLARSDKCRRPPRRSASNAADATNIKTPRLYRVSIVHQDAAGSRCLPRPDQNPPHTISGIRRAPGPGNVTAEVAASRLNLPRARL